MEDKLYGESGVELLARLSSRPGLSELGSAILPIGLRPGEIVQLSGVSGTGKSLLLLNLLTKCLLPKSYNGCDVGGLGVGVILIDTDHNISILKLASLMEDFIVSALRNDKSNDPVRLKQDGVCGHVDSIVTDAMRRLIILKTYSSIQLQMNFCSLGKILSANPNISLLVIDSLTSFYWEDTHSLRSYKKMDLYLKVLLEKLQKCIKDFKIITIFVKQEYFHSKTGDTKLPEINHRIDLSRSDKGDDMFYALINDDVTTYQYTISDKGLKWIDK